MMVCRSRFVTFTLSRINGEYGVGGRCCRVLGWWGFVFGF